VHILVVEDDLETADFLKFNLASHGHVVDQAADGRDGLFLATSGQYDVIIVDRLLPQLDGLSLVKAVRAAGVASPILFLTTAGRIDDRVEGLEAGGDDYLLKPFAITELLARINALRRRTALSTNETVLRVGDLEMDLVRRRVSRQGKQLDLLPREFRILEYLMRNAGRIVTRAMLLEQVWEFHFDPKTSVIETHMSRLRTKVDKPFTTELIHTVRGAGYRLDADS
jgi:two-component system, OmpR family, response regulator